MLSISTNAWASAAVYIPWAALFGTLQVTHRIPAWYHTCFVSRGLTLQVLLWRQRQVSAQSDFC